MDPAALLGRDEWIVRVDGPLDESDDWFLWLRGGWGFHVFSISTVYVPFRTSRRNRKCGSVDVAGVIRSHANPPEIPSIITTGNPPSSHGSDRVVVWYARRSSSTTTTDVPTGHDGNVSRLTTHRPQTPHKPPDACRQRGYIRARSRTRAGQEGAVLGCSRGIRWRRVEGSPTRQCCMRPIR